MSKKKLGPQTLLYPMPAVLVGAVVDGKANFMTAAWCSIACLNPPAISVAVNTARHTLKGIKQNGTFSINVPSADTVEKVDYCGIYSGVKRDKSTVFRIFFGELETVPLIEECPLNLECKLIHSLNIGSHDLIVGEILETHITESCLTDGKADPEKINPLVFSPAVQKYHRLGPVIAQAYLVGKEK
ncbi:MAG: flavin reductase family protein [Deltaproteobacteria bacterium]|nr:flavin reductase family protein [Deltaproteobacteria bacterium]